MFQPATLSDLSPAEFHAELESQLSALIAGEANWLANTANCAALLFHQMPGLNWAGFYFIEPETGDLVVGPFQGKPACARIGPGQGVCGAAAAQRRSIRVPEVHAFPGHIACDPQSRSELVIPLIRNGEILGVLDLDSPILDRFTPEDQIGLERLMEVLLSATG